MVTAQFLPLFWWEKLTCYGLERSACHKSAWCFKCLLEIWAVYSYFLGQFFKFKKKEDLS